MASLLLLLLPERASLSLARTFGACTHGHVRRLAACCAYSLPVRPRPAAASFGAAKCYGGSSGIARESRSTGSACAAAARTEAPAAAARDSSTGPGLDVPAGAKRASWA
ncbi:hypothetical protein SYNPS1DRAFT_27942 [Syncephalis pseudoplumigaleata]|uniref:Secreted protein n=1 Tax=Syncephalis pseudoplumigaleata TaxID=1712513 RepID=A0A4P9Z1Z4_9FUNG|nr:hypothetical protein SYNPS1DRAFT_27942 [Syncephalis pseudoplumigaleata]|eukprot:RKP26365.1 hypothetical protein SYNPS1DRAFT_27942 [Syncephalis pseudoplumigaleata]